MSKRSIDILVVGDISSCDAVRRALKDADFEFSLHNAAQPGSIRETLTGRRLPDVIISEPVLEDFSVLDLSCLLQECGLENLPVILVAGTGTEPEVNRCLENGINQYTGNPEKVVHACPVCCAAG